MLQAGLLAIYLKYFFIIYSSSSMVRRHCCVLWPFLKPLWCLKTHPYIHLFGETRIVHISQTHQLGYYLFYLSYTTLVIYRTSLPFLKAGVTLACFRSDGNSELVTDVLKLECKKQAKMSVFFLMIAEGISVSWHALETSSFKISLNISSLATFEIEKVACFFFLSLHTSPIVSMLGCFLYFTIS